MRPLSPDSPIGHRLLAARAAYGEHRWAGGIEAFDQAIVAALDVDMEWAVELAIEQLDGLLQGTQPRLVIELSTDRLAHRRPGPATAALDSVCQVLRAEAYLSIGLVGHTQVDVRSVSDDPERLGSLPAKWRLFLERLEILSSPVGTEIQLERLGELKERASRTGEETLAETIGRDLSLLSTHPLETGTRPNGGTTPHEALATAKSLRAGGRYQEAIELLKMALVELFDPDLRFLLLHFKTVLHSDLRDRSAVADARHELDRLADETLDPVRSRVRCENFGVGEPGSAANLSDVDDLIHIARVRTMIANGHLGRAADDLARIDSTVLRDEHRLHWHWAAAELELVRASLLPVGPRHANDALDHALAGERYAALTGNPEAELGLIRLRGRILLHLFSDQLAATDCWRHVHRREREIAAAQLDDQTRVSYLRPKSDEFDEDIASAYDLIRNDDVASVARYVGALDNARGTLLADLIQTGGKVDERRVVPTELPAVRAWLTRLGRSLDRDQAVWLLHPGPNVLYQALVTPMGATVHSRTVDRSALESTVDELTNLCANPLTLHPSPSQAAMTQVLEDLAAAVDVGWLLAQTTGYIERLAVVAGGALGDVPFSALPLPDGRAWFVDRFAISELPFAAAAPLLHQAAITKRGRGTLIVAPSDAPLGTGLTPPSINPGDDVLPSGQVNPAGIANAVPGYRIVRFDCHGTGAASDAGEEATPGWTYPADEPALLLTNRTERLVPGDLDPEQVLRTSFFERLDLSACQILVLGACETAMTARIGREERIGLPRAGLAAGATTVIAARWAATDLLTATMIDNFLSLLERGLTADRALRTAILRGRSFSIPSSHSGRPATSADHPAYWGCWSLFGTATSQRRSRLRRRRSSR